MRASSFAQDWTGVARKLAIAIPVCLATVVSGCSDGQGNQKTVFGALGGGILGSGACLLARGNALTCAAAGVAGAVIGGAIGHAFDERDRVLRDAAVQQALYDQSFWQNLPAQAETPPEPQPDSQTDAAPALAKAPPVRHHTAAHPPTSKPAVTWTNPQTANSGDIVPLRTYASPPAGHPCKVYREDYVRDGKQYSDTMQACPKADGTGFDFKTLS